MSQSPSDVISGLYAAFGQGDIPAILAMIDEDIAWHTPENLPHGGDFRGREAVGRFFWGIGGHWESLEVNPDAVVSGGDRVVALVRAHGCLRATGEEFEYSAAHAWIVRDGTPVRFDEYVNAPLTLSAGHPVTG
jgi:ketosteroid isomerase-like protein